MKRLIKPLALALGIGLFAGTGVAVAAPPIPNDTTPFQLDCPGFQIDVQVSGSSKSKDIEFLHPYGTPGVFLAVGLESWTLNGPVYPNAGLTGPGTVTDVCALLAP
ncbi:hypothetical protein [Arthrobacter humicola]|uniref:hypothetical protein n=1 Tax=Arthrobacter humicola TaxID=409291 RepID=UPI001FAC4240|nr:hypothetical protein [Arthrobacter humicola]MCI9870446.1 hypothetical protein [Arthrobacter humicola]